MCLEIIRQDPTIPEPFQTLATIYEESEEIEKSLQFALIAAHLGTVTPIYRVLCFYSMINERLTKFIFGGNSPSPPPSSKSISGPYFYFQFMSTPFLSIHLSSHPFHLFSFMIFLIFRIHPVVPVSKEIIFSLM
jgi:hypothetical protein